MSCVFSRKMINVNFNYKMNCSYLNFKNETRDLGVLLDKRLDFTEHIKNISVKAHKVLGFIIRNTKDFQNINTISLLFKTLLLPILEYASIIWRPVYNVHIYNLENVQRKFLKYLYFRKHGLYPYQGYDHSMLLDEFNYRSLASRRNNNSILYLYKVLHNMIDDSRFLSQIPFDSRVGRTRTTSTFYLDNAKTVRMANSPLYVMCNLVDENSIDILNISLRSLKNILL